MNEKKKKTKYYAIKEGKGVKDLIVNTWEECSKLVLGYNSVYKSFLTKEEAERYLKGVNVAKMKEKAIKGMEAKKRQKATTKVISVRIDKNLYDDFLEKCSKLELTKEKVIKEMIEEWLY